MLGQELMNEGVNVDLVVVSPLTRTLQTAVLNFGAVDEIVPMLACETCRERIGEYTSEGRAKTSELIVQWPKVDFSEIVSEEDPMFQNKEADAAVGERALVILDREMRQMPGAAHRRRVPQRVPAAAVHAVPGHSAQGFLRGSPGLRTDQGCRDLPSHRTRSHVKRGVCVGAAAALEGKVVPSEASAGGAPPAFAS